jgi:hypothetical protein
MRSAHILPCWNTKTKVFWKHRWPLKHLSKLAWRNGELPQPPQDPMLYFIYLFIHSYVHTLFGPFLPPYTLEGPSHSFHYFSICIAKRMSWALSSGKVAGKCWVRTPVFQPNRQAFLQVSLQRWVAVSVCPKRTPLIAGAQGDWTDQVALNCNMFSLLPP